MNPLPNYWELLALFEAEPKKLDPEIPWQYNRLEIESQRGADNIYCAIEPAYERFEFVWSHRGMRRLSLDLHWVSGMTINTGGGCDEMILAFRDPHLARLRIQLKPAIVCQWGTTSELP